ncbi:MAG: hypothetical protein BroJett018_29470 [Chloroflexota bacterium]|nr:MAG: hypothetical protein BroJett018_29470 [Chloroflexota bacterium]
MGDSIRKLDARLATVTSRDEKVDLLNELAYAHRYLDIEKTRTFASQALALAPQPDSPSPDGMALSRIMRSVADIFVGNYEAALLQLSEIEASFAAGWMQPRTRAWDLLNLGQCHRRC